MSALQEAYIKTAAWSRQESHPSQHHFHDTMFAWRDARGIPQLLCTQHPPTDLSTGRGVPSFFGIHLSFWPLQYPVSSCGFHNFVRAFAFAVPVLSADFPHCIHGTSEEGTANSAAAAVHAQPGCFFLSPALFLSLSQSSIMRQLL